MARKHDLAAALKATTKKPEEAAEAPQETPEEVEAVDAPKPYSRPSREGKKGILTHVSPAVRKQLAQMALDEDTSMQALMIEAINLLFEERDKPPIA